MNSLMNSLFGINSITAVSTIWNELFNMIKHYLE